jgi:predicted metal-dependent phosphotriesterase family hydrolase
MFTSYGGNGYAHILNTVKTMLLDEGVTEEQFNTLTVSNCADLLD